MNSINPITILDSILEDYASPRARRLIHSLILLAAAIISIYLAVDGDWKEFALTVGATVYAAANRANTDPKGVVLREEDFYDAPLVGQPVDPPRTDHQPRG